MRRGTGIGAGISGLLSGAALLLCSPSVAPAAPVPIPSPLGAASAAPNPADLQGVIYPLTSFLDWTQTPSADFTNQSLGEYAFAQEIAQAQSQVLHQFPGELTTALSQTAKERNPDAAEAFSEQMAAELLHLRPVVASDDFTNMANPDFMPDFDHNGVYGDPGDFTAMEHGTSMLGDGSHATGAFLYPCLGDDGTITYETTTGSCAAPGTPGATFKTGLAEQQTIVDARGLQLAATLWLPGTALARSATRHSFPAVVMSDGIASDQSDYFWIAMTLARQGDIVLTYDPAGQGASEGSAFNLFASSTPNCTFGGACHDLEDVVRWMVHDPITPIVDLSRSTPLLPTSGNGGATDPTMHDPAYAPAGENVANPALGLIDQRKLAVVGHSMGALSLLNYLWFQGQGPNGADGRPLPPLSTGIALSGAAPTAAVVPLQFQTSDFDGSPLLIGPAVGGVDLGGAGSGIGYAEMKPLYDQLRTSGPGTSALSLIVLEGGVHTDFIDTPYVPRTKWALAVSAHYATTWLDCHLKGDLHACLQAVMPADHLSTSFASEAAPSNGPLPHASRCITVPTTASLNDSPSQLADALGGHPDYTCKP